LAQQRLDQGFERGELIGQRRVEHHIRVLLVREDVLLLALAHGFPSADGIGGGVATVARVAQDATQHARIGGGDAVVAVQVQLREAGDVDAEAVFVPQLRHELRVQPVYAFQNDHIAGVELGNLTVHAATGLEVEARQKHFLAGDQVAHVSI